MKVDSVFKTGLAFLTAFVYFLMATESGRGQDIALWVNDLPAVPAWEERTFYVPISNSSPERLEIRLTFEPAVSFRWGDGAKNLLASGTQILVEDWHGVYPISVPFLGKDSLWRVVFTTLPVVSVKSAVPILSSVTDTPCEITVVSPDNRTEGSPVFRSGALAHLRGSSSLRYPKKSFSITLIDSAGDKMDADIMGIRADSKWIIDAMGADLSRMRNRICFDVWNDLTNQTLGNKKMKRNGTKGYFVEYILNGYYQGLCCFSDKVNRKLLGLTKMPSGENAPRGLLYKCMSGDYLSHFLLKDDSPIIASTDGVRWYDWELKYPDDHPSAGAWRPLIELIDFASQTKTDYSYVVEHFDDYFYTENVVDYCMFLFAFMLNDNMMHNTYLSVFDVTDDKRVWFIPWDLDASFGRNGWSGIVESTSKAWIVCQSTEPFRSFMDDTESPFFQSVCRRWMKVSNTLFSPESIAWRMKSYADLFMRSGAWQREVSLWDGKIVTPNNVVIHLSETPEEEVNFMQEWYVRNHQKMNEFFLYDCFISDNIAQIEDNRKANACYDLQGRRLLKRPERGVYICGGKKYVVK